MRLLALLSALLITTRKALSSQVALKFLVWVTLLPGISTAGPARSTYCLTLINEIVSSKAVSTPAEARYILNSFQSVFSQLNPGEYAEITPSTATGLIGHGEYSWGFTPVQAAGRIKGILEFMKKPEGENADDRRFSLMATVAGRENIQEFLNGTLSKSKEAEHLTHMAVSYWVPTAGLAYVMSAMASFDPIFSMWFAIGYQPAIESVIRIAYEKMTGLESKLQAIQQATVRHKNNIGGGNWLLLSSNAEISREDTKSFLNGSGGSAANTLDRSGIANPIVVRAIIRTVEKLVPRRDPFMAKIINDSIGKPETSWVGLDMLLETPENGEPELHIVLRGTVKSSPFPRKSKKVDATSHGEKEGREDLQGQGGRVLIPVRK